MLGKVLSYELLRRQDLNRLGDLNFSTFTFSFLF